MGSDRSRPDAPRTLLVASTGGHLDELVGLAPRFSPAPSRVEWVTHPGPQAQDLLRGQNVHLVPYVAPRDCRHAVGNLVPAFRILRTGTWERVVTTGAGVAVPGKDRLPRSRAPSGARVTSSLVTSSG